MFIDYITLLLVNAAAGLLLTAFYLVWGLDRPHQNHWAAGFAAVSVVALAAGLHMALTWPVPRLPEANLVWANVAFGELTVLAGALFLAMALATAKNWPLTGVAPLALVWGLTAMVIGAYMIRLNLSNAPLLTGSAIILAGAAAVGAAPLFARVRPPGSVPMIRGLLAVMLAVAAGIFLFIAAGAYLVHLRTYSQP